MLDGELAESLQDKLLDLFVVPVGAVDMVWNPQGREIRGVNRVMDGDGDLELCVVVHGRARDTSPHWLERHYQYIAIDKAETPWDLP